jgi:hypothetical protein
MQQNQGKGVQISLGWGSDGKPGVVLILPASTFVEMPDGEPRPGVVVPSAVAREFAWALLLSAEQLANGTPPAPPPTAGG